ncbi:MAG: heme o synthase [Candidatus Thermoplasmatota archaeon]|jgi:protoheme IX farnesyltransferase|nr:heme o synthase [Candidatus Thermoplasmatota archaeon]MCL5793512.1 heme o synthase [Candidatus Thermoplasmatota archaeon]
MSLRDIIRITKAEITFLILVVAVTGFLAAPGASTRLIILLPLLVAGGLSSISASLFNNIYDRDIDVIMARTSYRSNIVNQENYRRFIAYSSIILIFASAVAYFLINLLTLLFILGGFVSYVLLYTMVLKRRTSLNIVIGGIAGSFPALAGWSAVTGSVSLTAIYIALLVFVWTPTHFWSLAMGTKKDYTSAGVPMLPSLVPENRAFGYIVANSGIMVIYSLLPFFLPELAVGTAYFFVAIILDAILIYFMVAIYVKNLAASSFKQAFHFSNLYLLVLLVSIWWIIA